MITDAVLDDLWNRHVDTWKNCGRCRLREWRLLIDPTKAKQATSVPFGMDFNSIPILQAELDYLKSVHSAHSLLHYPRPRRCRMVALLPCPDRGQELISNLFGSGYEGSSVSEQLLVVHDCAEKAQGMGVGISPSDWGISVAIGCRPTDYTNTSSLLKPSATFINPCTARWVTEVALMDPEMIVVMGHHAYVALNSHNAQVIAASGRTRNSSDDARTTKISAYNSDIGEISKLLIEINGEIKYYPVYVAPDILTVSLHARADQWQAPFSGKPTRVPIKEGPAHIRWHLFVASVLVDEITARKNGQNYHSNGWASLLRAWEEYYEDMDEVLNRAESMYDQASLIADRESSQFGAHYSMMYGDVNDSETTNAVVEEEDEDVEEVDESELADDSDE